MSSPLYGQLVCADDGSWWIVSNHRPPEGAAVPRHVAEEAAARLGNGQLPAYSYVRASVDADGAVRRIEVFLALDESAAHLRSDQPPATLAHDRLDAHLQRLSRQYARSWQSGRPQVNAYTHLRYHAGPPERRRRPRHRTAPDMQGDAAVRSGWICLTLTVRSPLCVFGAEQRTAATHRAEMADTGPTFVPLDDPVVDGHRVVSYRKGDDGHAEVAGATIKGAMRTWLEAITSSPRQTLNLPVAWRATRISADRTDELSERRIGRLRLRLDDDSPAELDASTPQRRVRRMQCDIVEQQMWSPPDLGLGRNPDPQTLLAARRKAVLQHWDVDHFEDGRTVHGRTGTPTEGQTGRLKIGVSVQGDVSVHVATGDRSDRANPVDPERLLDWQAAHDGSGHHPRGGRIDDIPFQRPDPRHLHDGDLVWYAVKGDAVAEFGRIRQFRWASRTAIRDRIPPQQRPPHQRPTTAETDPDLLDVADRVLGRIDRTAERSWAGRLRFLTARTATPPTEDEEVTLTLLPLATPKPAAAGFYLDGRTDEVSWLGEDTEQRGSKIYLHHLPPPGVPRDRLVGQARDANGQAAATEHNATVTALTAGTFEAHIRFEDLSDDELGALLLACTLRFTDADAERGWKLGVGKPLGMGSVAVNLHHVSLDDPAQPPDPTCLQSQPLSANDVDELVRAARERFMLEGDPGRFSQRLAETYDAAARLDTVHDRTVGYPAPQQLPAGRPDGRRKRQPNAGEALLDARDLRLR